MEEQCRDAQIEEIQGALEARAAQTRIEDTMSDHEQDENEKPEEKSVVIDDEELPEIQMPRIQCILRRCCEVWRDGEMRGTHGH